MAQVLATVTAAVHFLALAYIGLGGFVAWRWPRSILVHVFFAGWGAVVIAFPSMPCPLTVAEDYFRNQQGLGDLPGGFNEYYIYGTLFPENLTTLVGGFALLLVVVSYVGVYLQWRHRRLHPQTPGGGELRAAG
ncbi:MAG: DUF2784 family protein [Pseudonocardiaceae bacterium]|nr:DUF2784 family protein [Pseudonocardiaceae bacterium]